MTRAAPGPAATALRDVKSTSGKNSKYTPNAPPPVKTQLYFHLVFGKRPREQGCSELTRLRRCRAAGKLYASQETLEIRQDYNPETQGDGSFGRRSQSRASAARRCPPLSPPRHILIWFILVGWLVPTTTNRTCHAAIMARLVAQLIVNKKGLKGIKYLNRTHAANGNL